MNPNDTPIDDTDRMNSELTTRTQYAYGDDAFNEVECPARVAGKCPAKGGAACDIAQLYDEEVLRRIDSNVSEGAVNEDTARDAWLAAVETAKDNNWELVVDAGDEVAIKLGWS